MLQTFKNGQTSIVLRVKLLDSSKTDGSGLTGLNNASSGLIISTIADNESSATAYTVAGSTIDTISTLGTYAAPTTGHCGFKEVDATNHKGVYEIQLANVRFAVSNAKSLLVSLSGATNLAQTDFVVQLQNDDPYVAKPTNYASLSIDGTGRVDVAKIAGTTQTARDIGASVLVGDKTGFSLTQAFPTNFAALGIGAGGHILTVDTLTTYTGNTPQTGDAYALIGTAGAGLTALGDTRVAHLDADVSSRSTFSGGAVASVTGDVGGNVVGSVGSVTGLTPANLDAAVSTRLAAAAYTAPDNASITAIKAKTDNLPIDPADESLIVAATTAIYDRIGAPVGASVAADIAAVKTDTGTTIPAGIDALSIPTAADNADALLDRADAIEAGVTMRQALRLKLAVLVGKLSGAGTGTETFRNGVADSKGRVTATVDANGNRTAITTDAT